MNRLDCWFTPVYIYFTMPEPHREGSQAVVSSSSLDRCSPHLHAESGEHVLGTNIYQLHASRRFKRMYHRVMSGLERDGNVRLLTLTSGFQSPADFQGSFRKLRMRLLRRKLLVDYIRCPELTTGGLRHEHILFRGHYIDQVYLSVLWYSIHKAEVVDIRKAWGRRGLACYLADYLAKAPAGRYSYSWGWVWRGYAKSWKILKKVAIFKGWDKQKLLTKWRIHVRLNVKPEEYYQWSFDYG